MVGYVSAEHTLSFATMKVYSLLLLTIIALAGCGQSDITITRTPPISDVERDVATDTPEPAPLTATDIPTTAPEATEPPTQTAIPTDAIEPTAIPEPTLVEAISLELVADGFTKPIFLTHANDDRLFVVEQDGVVFIVENGERMADPFLDINDRVGSDASEQGLLSLAFHPDYPTTNAFFVYYTDNDGNVVISRFNVTADANAADADSEVILLTIGQPYRNHNGGQIAFGPDGHLYIGVGDGGSANDPENYGLNRNTLLGKMLRIDIDAGDLYAVPADNPFVNDDSARNEIWAYGLRNPWRFAFDRATGDLFMADVGQNQWEEVNWQSADSPGGESYGWNGWEGNHCFREDCNDISGVFPIVEYDHGSGCSITGGYVYRGASFPQLTGNYFYGDFCTGLIWATLQPESGAWPTAQVVQSGLNISSFGEDANGELYVIDHGGGVYLIVP